MRRVIRNADWLVTWDEAMSDHVYRKNVDLAFSEDGILGIGEDITGHFDEEISGTDLMVMPGLVNIHCHPADQPLYRGFTEEFGNPRLFNSGRQRFREALVFDDASRRASASFAIAEMLACGVTTMVDLSEPYDGWIDVVESSGIRACLAPMFRSAEWYTDTGQETKYRWSRDNGFACFAAAADLMDRAERSTTGRLSAMVAPAQVDTCSADLFREAIRLSEATDRVLFTHASQSYAEFNGMTRRHNMTPIEWLDSLGFLGDRTIIGHAVFTDEHPWILWDRKRDLELLSRSRASIAHCPTPFARDGTLLHDLGAYRSAGINIGIGTDTHPHNLIEEMRWAEILARVASGAGHTFDTRRLFHAATAGGSRALQRGDIGRLMPGCKSDIVTIDLNHPAMSPVRDPLRSLIYSAAERAVRDVYVNGSLVVRDGQVLTIDRATSARDVAETQRQLCSKAEAEPDLTSPNSIVPLSLSMFQEPGRE